eukprot:gene4598-7980_t
MIQDSLSSKVELIIKCRKLIKLDTFSASDPMCIVYKKEKSKWKEFGRTEFQKDQPNPVFKKTFMMDFKFEETQYLKFLVLDVDDVKSSKIEDQEVIGEIECKLAEIIGSRGSMLTKDLIYPKDKSRKNGLICVTADEVKNEKYDLTFRFSCKGLDKKDFFGKSDPFLRFSKQLPDGSWKMVHETEYYKVQLNPMFNEFKLSGQNFCSNDFQKPVKVECLDWNWSGKTKLIGETVFTLEKLANISKGASFDLINPKYKWKPTYSNSGVLKLDNFVLVKEPTFLDYIMSGFQISLMVGIDFTASNGNINDVDSLHHMQQGKYNDYQKAIISVGNILNYYDSDKKYPVYGFGAKLPNGQTSHCFHCNFDPQNPEVYGVDGILSAYNYSVTNVKFFGPTNFAPLITACSKIAGSFTGTEYFVLLILTDGEITDMDATVDAIVKASTLPMSIIIIGIGNEDFKNMIILDGDDKALVSDGVRAKRDIVQFVPFNQFKNESLESLAEEVLQEVPTQFLSYMKTKGISPQQKIRLESFSL